MIEEGLKSLLRRIKPAIILFAVISSVQAKELKLKILDTDSLQPLEKASVVATLGGRQFLAASNLEGTCSLNFPEVKIVSRLNIKVTLRGYIPSIMEWKLESGTLAEVPEEYVFYLEKGGAIGGLVTDEAGEPIRDVAIHIFARMERMERERTEVWDKVTYTNADGKWHYESVPSEMKKIRLRLVHEDYVANKYFDYGQGGDRSLADLFGETDVIKLVQSLTVNGLVQDKENKPIEGAKVWAGDAAGWPKNAIQTKTNPQGEFKFKNCKVGETVFMAQAEGFGPDVKKVEIDKEKKKVVFLMFAGRTLRGRVVDQSGAAIEGANIEAVGWREGSIPDFHAVTDKDGKFQWNGAPGDEVLYDISKSNYARLTRHPITVAEKEIVITLNGKLGFRGRVVDEETGAPVEKFWVRSGIAMDENQPVYWGNRKLEETQDGAYDSPVPYFYSESNPGQFPKVKYYVRIEAEGYLPASSEGFKEEAGPQVVDFKLKKGHGPSGIVKQPDGSPASGADVLLAVPGNYTQVENGRLRSLPKGYVDERQISTQTDKEGKFTFPPQSDPFIIAALHDQGWAEVTEDALTSSSEIKLLAWGRIEGTLKNKKKPLPNEMVSVSPELVRNWDGKKPYIFYIHQTKTDSEGKFTFERVIPAESYVNQLREEKNGKNTYNKPVLTDSVEIEPGKTTIVNLGSRPTREVIGRITLPAGADPSILQKKTHGFMQTRFPEPPVPEEVKRQGPKKRQDWINENWIKSPEGKTYRRRMSSAQSKEPQLSADGFFRIEDVWSGPYEMTCSVVEPNEDPKKQRLLGMARREFDVPEIPDGAEPGPLDLGNIELQLTPELKPGDEVPDIEERLITGDTYKISDFRGKYLLFVTWWNPENKNDYPYIPDLNAIYAQFRNDKRFAMIGSHWVYDLDEFKKLIEKNKIEWPQGYSENFYKSFRWIRPPDPPAILFIGPDGKLIASEIPLSDLKGVIEKSLGVK